MILGAIAVTVYGIAVLFFKTEGAIRSFRNAVLFLWNRQSAFWLYVVLFFGYLIASFSLILFTYPFILIPVVGTIISFPLQVLSSYIGLAILATIFIYYYEAEIRKPEASVETMEPAETVKTTDESSSGPEDIFDAGVPKQEETPPVKGPTEVA
jgi:predicted membrane protein